MGQDSDEEEVLSDDTGFISDASEYDTDLEEKFVPSLEIRALNGRSKHCMIQSYYTTGGALSVCAACTVLLADIDIVGMYFIKKHNINYIDAYKTRNLTDNDFFCMSKIAMETVYHCYRNITFPASDEKIVNLSIGGDANVHHCWEGDPALKEKYIFRDTCEDECFQCDPCRSALKKYHMALRHYAIKDMERRCNVEWNANCWSSATRKRPHLAVGHRQSAVARIARLASAKTQLERRFVHIGGGYASSGYANAGNIVFERVRDVVERHDSVKVNAAFNSEFATKDKRANKSIITKNIEIYRCTDTREWYERHVVEPILTSLEEFQERNSGWALSRIHNLIVNVNKLNPMHAGCHFEVPRAIMFKKAVISVRTTDNACFAWSVVAALYPAERHLDRESSYPHYTTVLNLRGIEFPMTLKDIPKFEHLNAVSTNVYGIVYVLMYTTNVYVLMYRLMYTY
ncbi:hypothetical protein ALC57_00617 [Trachymyrmex cornetzi]|uniref:C2H2-type domain-containing protein n=1 Tax=Trachymyrmex cornetzi TaxID=471704 RepID=A0A151JRA1_9HYME|nr:hypothetical protein ALC57_00617 [Trachymyrmex cornetzi]